MTEKNNKPGNELMRVFPDFNTWHSATVKGITDLDTALTNGSLIVTQGIKRDDLFIPPPDFTPTASATWTCDRIFRNSVDWLNPLGVNAGYFNVNFVSYFLNEARSDCYVRGAGYELAGGQESIHAMHLWSYRPTEGKIGIGVTHFIFPPSKYPQVLYVMEVSQENGVLSANFSRKTSRKWFSGVKQIGVNEQSVGMYKKTVNAMQHLMQGLFAIDFTSQ